MHSALYACTFASSTSCTAAAGVIDCAPKLNTPTPWPSGFLPNARWVLVPLKLAIGISKR